MRGVTELSEEIDMEKATLWAEALGVDIRMMVDLTNRYNQVIGNIREEASEIKGMDSIKATKMIYDQLKDFNLEELRIIFILSKIGDFDKFCALKTELDLIKLLLKMTVSEC